MQINAAGIEIEGFEGMDAGIYGEFVCFRDCDGAFIKIDPQIVLALVPFAKQLTQKGGKDA